VDEERYPVKLNQNEMALGTQIYIILLFTYHNYLSGQLRINLHIQNKRTYIQTGRENRLLFSL
jgi:hypothetical protein